MNNFSFKETEKWLKKSLKNKISIDQKTIVTYLMKGMLGIFAVFMISQIGYGAIGLVGEKRFFSASDSGNGNAEATGVGSVAAGSGSVASGGQAIGIGDRIQVTGAQATGLGNDISVIGYGAIGIGGDDAQGYNSAIDGDAYAIIREVITDYPSNDAWTKTASAGNGSVAIGVKAVGLRNGSVAIGVKALSVGTESTAIGTESLAMANHTTAIGKKAWAKGAGSIALGNEAIVKGDKSISIGKNTVETKETISLGLGNSATGTGEKNILLGNNLTLSNKSRIVIVGNGSSSTVDGGVVLGNNASVTETDGVAIGNNSVSSRVTENGYNPYSKENDIEALSSRGTVDIGKRILSSVSAGKEDTDAVNVKQLKLVGLSFQGNEGGSQKFKLSDGDLSVVGDGTDITTTGSGNNKLSININKSTEVTTGDTKVVTSNATYDAISKARTKVTQSKYINVTGGEESGIDSKNYTVSLNYNNLKTTLDKDYVKYDFSNVSDKAVTDKVIKGSLSNNGIIEIKNGDDVLVGKDATIDIIKNSISTEYLDSDLNEKISKIEVNEQQISLNESAIAENKGNIDGNTEAISTNTENITNNTNKIAANTKNITNNTNKITVNTNKITANEEAIGKNTTKITNLGNNSLTFNANSGTAFTRKNNEDKTLEIKAGDLTDTKFKGNNLKTEIKTTTNGAEILIGLNQDLTEIHSISGNDAKIALDKDYVHFSKVSDKNTSLILTGVRNGEITENSTQAINGSQLNPIIVALGATVDSKDGNTVKGPIYSLKAGTDNATEYKTVPLALTALDEAITTLGDKTFTVKADVNTLENGFVRKNKEDKTLEIKAGDITNTDFKGENLKTEIQQTSDGAKVLIGLKDKLTNIKSISGGTSTITLGENVDFGNKKLTSVSKGTTDNDAVNYSQLKELAGTLGGKATIDNEGNVVKPTYKVGDKTVETVGAAINEINSLTKGMSENTLFEYADEDGNPLIKKDDKFYKSENGKLVEVGAKNVKIRAKDKMVVRNIESALGTKDDIAGKYKSDEYPETKKEGLDAANNITNTLIGLDDSKKLNAAATVKDLQAVAITGVNFTGNTFTDSKDTHKHLGDKLIIKGEGTDKEKNDIDYSFNSATGNIRVDSDGTDLTVKLNKDIVNMGSITFKGEDNKDNLNITATGLKFNSHKEEVDGEEEVFGTGKITGVADIDEETATGDYAVNKRYVDKKTKTINNQIFAISSGAEGIVVYTNKKGERIVKARDGSKSGNFYLLDENVSSDLYLKYKTADGTTVVKDVDGKYYELTQDNKIDKSKEKIIPESEEAPKAKSKKIKATNIQASIVDENGETQNPIVFNNVRRGDITKGSHNAINGSQLYNLGEKLGLEVETEGEDKNKLFKDPTFIALKKANGEDTPEKEKPKTFVEAINVLNNKVNEGFLVKADKNVAEGIENNQPKAGYNNQYLGSSISVKTGNITETKDNEDIKYSDSNLITEYKKENGNGVVSIGLKEKPEFKEITIKENDDKKLVLSPEKTTVTEIKDGKTVKSAEYGLEKTEIKDETTTDVVKTLTQTAAGTVVSEIKNGTEIKNAKYEIGETTLVDKSENGKEYTNISTAKNIKLSDKEGNNVETTATSIKVTGNDNTSLEIAKDSIKSKDNKMTFTEAGKITLSNAKEGATDKNVTLDGVKDGAIKETSKEAVNGSQLYDMQKNVLGYTTKDDGTLKEPTFKKLIDNITKAETIEKAPTTFKDAIDTLTDTVNKGFIVNADQNNADASGKDKYNNQYLGSSISVKAGGDVKIKKDDIDYSGSNLVTEYKNVDGNGVISIGIKEKPKFKEITVKENDNKTLTLSPDKTVLEDKSGEKSIKLENTASGTTITSSTKADNPTVDKKAYYGLESSSIENGTNKSETKADSFVISKKGTEDIFTPEVTIKGSKGEAGPSMDFANKDGKITGLEDVTGKSDDVAVNKGYVDRIVKEVDKNRPFEYFTKDGDKVIRGRDGKLYKENDLANVKFDGNKYVNQDGTDANLAVVDNENVSLNAMPNGENKPIKLGNIASGLDPKKVGNATILATDAKELVSGINGLNNINDKSKLNTVATVGDVQALSIAGLDFVGNDKQSVHRNLGTELKISGEGEFNGTTTATGNIKVERNSSSDGLDIKLASHIKNIDSIATTKKDGISSKLNQKGLIVSNNKEDNKLEKASLSTNGTSIIKANGDTEKITANYNIIGSSITKTEKEGIKTTISKSNNKLDGLVVSKEVNEDSKTTTEKGQFKPNLIKLEKNEIDGNNTIKKSVTENLDGTEIKDTTVENGKTTKIKATYKKDESRLSKEITDGSKKEKQLLKETLTGTEIYKSKSNKEDNSSVKESSKYQLNDMKMYSEINDGNGKIEKKETEQNLDGTTIKQTETINGTSTNKTAEYKVDSSKLIEKENGVIKKQLTQTTTGTKIENKEGNKTAEYNVDKTKLDDGTDVAEFKAGQLTFSKKGEEDNTPKITITSGKVDNKGDVTEKPTIAFISRKDEKIGEVYGGGLITGLADITDKSTGDTAVNKRYVDRIVDEVDKNRPFEYFTKDGDKVIRGRDGKLYKETELLKATYDSHTGKYSFKDKLDEVKNEDVVLNAMPNDEKKPIKLGNIASGLDPEKIGKEDNKLITLDTARDLIKGRKEKENEGISKIEGLNEIKDKTKLNTVATVGDLQAVSIAGLEFTGNEYKAQGTVHRPLGSVLTIKGEGTDKVNDFASASGNIQVDSSSNEMIIKLAKRLENLESATFKNKEKTAGTTIAGDGTTIKELNTTTHEVKENGKSAEYKLDGTTLKDDKGNKSNLTSENLIFGPTENSEDKSTTKIDKESITLSDDKGNAEITITSSHKNSHNENVAPSIAFSDNKGLITGLADITDKSTGDTAVNKNYIDKVEDEINSNRPFDYYTKEDNEKVIKGRDGKLYKKSELEGAIFVPKKDDVLAHYEKDGEKIKATLDNTKVVIKAEPNSDGALIVNNVASALGTSNEIGKKYNSSDDDKKIAVTKAKELLNGTAGENVQKGLLQLTETEDKSILNSVATVGDLQATSIAGLEFTGNESKDNKNTHKALGNKLTIKGEGTDKIDNFTSATGNIRVDSNGKELEVRLSDKLTNMTSFETKTDNGASAKLESTKLILNGGSNAPVILSNDGLNNGGNKITNVADGEIKKDSKDAVNGGQIHEIVTQTNNKFDNLDKKIGKGLGNAAAMSALEFMDIGTNQATVAAAVGNYRGNQAVAIGIQAAPTENTRVHAKISVTPGANSETMAGVGGAWRFNWR